MFGSRCSPTALAVVASIALVQSPGGALAEEPSDFPEIRLGFGYAAGSWCNPSQCGFDPTGLLFSGQVSTRNGLGWYGGGTGTFSMRDACVGIRCGEAPGTFFALTGGGAYRRGVLSAHLGAGIGATPRSPVQVPVDAMVGIELHRGHEAIIHLQGHWLVSATSPERYIVGVLVSMSNRARW